MVKDAAHSIFKRGSDPLRFVAHTSQSARDTHVLRIMVLKLQPKRRIP